MKELSLHILDIVQNSISAGAGTVKISISESCADDVLVISVEDNGCGMSREFVSRVTDPFTTTRTTRKVGLGIPLFMLAAQQAGGSFDINSREGAGTTVTARMVRSNIDRSPIGDMAGTIVNLISVNPCITFIYLHKTDSGEFLFDTNQIKEILGDVSITDYSVLTWIKDYINENLNEIKAETY